MPRLHIALQEGFAGEPVTISVDGHEVYKRNEVHTRTQIGLADSVETTHDAGTAAIEIRAGETTATITATITGDLFVGVSRSKDGRIVHRSSSQQFRYM